MSKTRTAVSRRVFNVLVVCLSIGVLVLNLFTSSTTIAQTAPTAEVSTSLKNDVSPPLISIKDDAQDEPPHEKRKPKPVPNKSKNAPTTGAVQGAPGAASAPTTTSFDGVGQGFSGPSGTFTVSSAPPDTNGAVGLNHYIETVNSDFAIFNKSGTAIYGPVHINTLWSGFGGPCQTRNDGDPVVLYDRQADRWLIAQFAINSSPNQMCVAVSTTSDPTGSYYRYAFADANFPVWWTRLSRLSFR